MNLVVFGVSFRNAPVEIRERVAFNNTNRDKASLDLASRYGCEASILSTCNRVELYLANPIGPFLPDQGLIAEFLSEFHKVPVDTLQRHLLAHAGDEGVKHLFRVASSLDSLIVGEGQIAGQVKESFDTSLKLGTTGPLLNSLFQSAQKVAKRVRTDTGISKGHVSVSSVAVDYVKQVFDHFGDKTILVIGAGKMGRLTLKHLRELNPKRILVTNRSPEKANELAAECGGVSVPWERLDQALLLADIILSTTGATEPIVTAKRYSSIRAGRGGRSTVILDIAVPRDFDPAIHDGDTTFLFNIDDLKHVREETLAKRRSHVDRAEAIVEEERRKFIDDWDRRKNGQVIAKLTQEFEARRQEVLVPLLSRLNGKLGDKERQEIEGAFRLFQNKLLHGPISALGEASRDGSHSSLLEAIKRLFRLE